MTGWWFQTCFIFHIFDNPSQLTFNFFKMVETTNQMMWIYISLDWIKGKSTGNHGFYHQI